MQRSKDTPFEQIKNLIVTKKAYYNGCPCDIKINEREIEINVLGNSSINDFSVKASRITNSYDSNTTDEFNIPSPVGGVSRISLK